MSDQQPVAGWYPQGNEERYWDGQQWTDQRRPLPAPQYAQPQQPVKQKHTLRNVLLVVIVLGVLFIGGCFAIIGVTANEVSKSIDETTKSDAEPGGPDNPLKIAEGKAFEVQGFDYAAGWRVTKDYGLAGIEGLKVTNNRGDKDSALVEVKFWKGSEVLAVVDCTTEPIAPDTTTKVDCLADDFPKGYDRITINDTF